MNEENIQGVLCDEKEVKRVLFDILCFFDEICKKNGLSYSLAYGTLIGAARHSGFIPWDDDIDVIMPQDDYLKLLKLPGFFENNKVQRYSLFCPQNEEKFGKEYIYPYAKLVDNWTQCHYIRTKDSGGAFVDIFPVTGLPKSLVEQRKFLNKTRKYMVCLSIANRKDGDKKETLIQKVKNVRRRLYRVKYRYFRNSILKYAFAYPFDNSKDVAVSVWPFWKERETEIMPRHFFEEYIELPFEGKMFPCIKEYDEFLTRTYGNWKELPPEKERIPHHEFQLYKLCDK